MAKSMIIFAAALALSAMSTEALARGGGGGGGGGSKSGQNSSNTTSAARSVSSGATSGKRIHKPITVTTPSNVTVNKSRTADKSYKVWDQYIRQ